MWKKGMPKAEWRKIIYLYSEDVRKEAGEKLNFKFGDSIRGYFIS